MGSNYSTGPNTVLKDVDLVNKRSLNSKSISGAALMLSLWALFLLSTMIISWALDIDSRLALSGNANRVLAAEAMAASGAEVALHPSIAPGSPNLHRQMGDRESYEVGVTGEGGRLNLNWLTAGEDPTRVGILRRYLELKGVEMNDRDTMIDSLLDWVSPNIGLHHLNAPPETDDYHPAHAPLTSVDELKKIFGWTEFTSKQGWDEDFTINSSGPIDLAWASRDVLRSLPGIGDDVVDRFLELRRGPDGIDGTADDTQFSSLADIQSVLGLTTEQFQQISSLVGFKDQIFRILSTGKSGDLTRSLQMIVRKGGSIPLVISWKEL
jgi:Type II secretion system (T2SS), protein K